MDTKESINEENVINDNSMENGVTPITEPTPKKRRGRPAGYRKTKDGTWIKLDNPDTSTLKKNNKKTGRKESVTGKNTNTVVSEHANLDEPSDAELAAIEAEDEESSIEIDAMISKAEDLSTFASKFIIRRVVPNYEEYARNCDFVNTLKSFPVERGFLQDFIKLRTPTFGDIFDLFRNNMSLDSSSPSIAYSDEEMEDFLGYMFKQNNLSNFRNELKFDFDGRAINLYQVQNKEDMSIVGYIFPIFGHKFHLKSIDPCVLDVIYDQYHVLKSIENMSFGCIYTPRDLKQLENNFKPVYIENIEFSNGIKPNYAKIYKFDLLSIEHNTSSGFIIHPDSEALLFAAHYKGKELDDSEESVDDLTDEGYTEEDDGEDDTSSEESDYLIDRKYDETYQEECDRLLEKSIRESNKGRLPSYDELFYPGTTRDRREFDSLDNGNYYHRDTGLSDGWNPDDF